MLHLTLLFFLFDHAFSLFPSFAAHYWLLATGYCTLHSVHLSSHISHDGHPRAPLRDACRNDVRRFPRSRRSPSRFAECREHSAVWLCGTLTRACTYMSVLYMCMLSEPQCCDSISDGVNGLPAFGHPPRCQPLPPLTIGTEHQRTSAIGRGRHNHVSPLTTTHHAWWERRPAGSTLAPRAHDSPPSYSHPACLPSPLFENPLQLATKHQHRQRRRRRHAHLNTKFAAQSPNVHGAPPAQHAA